MADEKLNSGPGEEKLPEAPAPVTADGPQAPAPEQAAAPTPQQEGPAQPEPGDVVVSFDKINELMNDCLLYTSPSPRDRTRSRMPSSA